MTLKMIGVEESTKNNLDRLKEYERETYDDTIDRLIVIAERSKEGRNDGDKQKV